MFANRTSLKPALYVGPILRQKTPDGVRISAGVNGRQIWFESGDADLLASPEAFGSALLIPAMHAKVALAIDHGVCAVWAENIRRIMDIASRWWNYSLLDLQVDPVVRHVTPHTATALCFSGGVDSFHSLLCGPRPLDMLVSAIGYDVKLDDAPRIDRVKSSVRTVAAEMGMRAVFIASNLRRHAAFRAVAWERSHGGALAALGHLLSEQVGRLAISASCAREDDQPWGSRWDIDPFFSSSALTVDHIGAEIWRADKLRTIAHEEIVRQHLRVCWENRNAEPNCCQCEKCVRTMLVLATCGQLEKYPRFHGGKGLVQKIDRLPQLQSVMIPVYVLLLKQGLTSEQAAAVRRLISRSLERQPSLFEQAKKCIRQFFMSGVD
jgi:hypothetical protein